MNLTEAFNQALPDLPARSFPTSLPKLTPKIVSGEHIEDGEPRVTVVIRGKSALYKFSPMEWQLMQLFDGQRTYEEVAATFGAQTGTEIAVDQVRDFADGLDAAGFFEKTPLEQNIALWQKLVEERSKHAKKKSRHGDISYIAFSGWDPDEFFNRIYPKLTFLYSRWFTALSLVAVGFMLYVWITRWQEYGHDTLVFFDFSTHTAMDLVELYVITVAVLFIHETAHGLTCKHFGGQAHDMGFHLIYLTPAFYCDVTEAWASCDRWQRIKIVVSGVWSELLICAIFTPIWAWTPAGSPAHELAYKMMLITGLSCVVVNWNPLIKLDGYYILAELVQIFELKENSTAYVTAWVRRKIFRLPVEVPYVPKRRRLGYIVYALLSGLYSYSLLFVFVTLSSNVFRKYYPEWYFIPSLAIGYLLFRSRIRTFGRFMNTLYLDKRDRVRSWFTPKRTAVTATAAVLLLFLPVWRESTEGRFALEPAQRAVVRTLVPGTVAEVYVDEGDRIATGAPLARLENLELEGQAARALADFRLATALATSAQMQYAAYGPAERERQKFADISRTLDAQVAQLRLQAPISGVVITPRVHNRIGSYVTAGTELAEVADLSTLRARIYVPEFEMRRVRVGAPARLLPSVSAEHLEGVVTGIAPSNTEIEPGLIELSAYRGIRPPSFYVIDVLVKNPDGKLKVGTSGIARIYGGRRSIASFLREIVWDFTARKIW